jgi:PelA/Pel-15E family pectate lyase
MMRKSVIALVFVCCAVQVQAQQAFHNYKLDTRMFASNAGHWYGIKDKHNVINPQKKQPKYKADNLKAIGDNILLYQKANGGWAKNYDVMAILTPAQKDSIFNDKGNLNTTFDNGTTYTHVQALAGIFQATQDVKYKHAALAGINFTLSAQYPNGGWPQYFPLRNDYSRHITYNDDVFTGIMQLLKEIKDNNPLYSFVSHEQRQQVAAAYQKGIDCLLRTQINDVGEITAWGQQHDEVTLLPAWGRAYEPPAICNAESAGIVLLLMDTDQPTQPVKDAVQYAVNWFKQSAIADIRVSTVAAEPDTSRFTISKTERVVVTDTTAPPIWSRYTELQTHRPLFCNRDGKLVYTLKDVARERRSGYAWYTYNPQKVLDRYPEWARKWLGKAQ